MSTAIDIHERKCWDCGSVADHASRIAPEVCCKKCGSQDTRATKRPSTPKTPLFPIDMSESTPGMKVDLSGVLGRAADKMKRTRDYKHLEWPLQQLEKHIEALRASKSDEEALANLHAFLKLWV